MDRIVKSLAGQQRTGGRERQDAGDGNDCDDDDGQPVLADDSRVDHHAHGDEENRAEQVLDAGEQVLDAFALDGFREDGTHYECAQGRRETGEGGEGNHPEAQADGDDEEYLVAEEAFGFLQQQGNDVHPHEEPQDQEKRQPDEAEEHLGTGELLGDRKCRKQYHQQDRDEVFHYQGAEDERCVRLLLEAEVIVSLDDDGGGAH